jgi:hypothetical protein
LTAFPSLMREHQIQENLAPRGVASASIIVNALELSTRPILDQFTRPDWTMAVPRMT